MRRALLALVLLGGLCTGLTAQVRARPVGALPAASPGGRPPIGPLTLPAHLRVMVFAPHPDDETVGVGGLIARLTRRHVPVRIVFLTNGDAFTRAAKEGFDLKQPTDADFVALGQLRQREAVAAAHDLGVERRDVRFLGFPDWGLAELWRAHWSRAHPYTSPFTREDSPPYSDAVDTDVDYDGQDLTSVLSHELRQFRPTVIVMPHPYDRHEDHVHTSYFVTEAVSVLVARGALASPTILTYLVHFPSWPAVRPPDLDRALSISELRDTRWLGIDLAPGELAAKRAALARYKSQLDVMDGFLRRFLLRNELYARIDPDVLARIASIH